MLVNLYCGLLRPFAVIITKQHHQLLKGLRHMTSVTESNVRQFTEHVSTRQHAMAGATIAASAAIACSLGEVCVRISIQYQDTARGRDTAEKATKRLDDIRQTLLTLADEDGAAITAFATFSTIESSTF